MSIMAAARTGRLDIAQRATCHDRKEADKGFVGRERACLLARAVSCGPHANMAFGVDPADEEDGSAHPVLAARPACLQLTSSTDR
jgi:hypothetical protein